MRLPGVDTVTPDVGGPRDLADRRVSGVYAHGVMMVSACGEHRRTVFREMVLKMRVVLEHLFPEMGVVEEVADKNPLHENGHGLGHDHLGLRGRRRLHGHQGNASLGRHTLKGPQGGLGRLKNLPRRTGCEE